MAHTSRDKQKLLNRVRRIRGQIEALERALESEKECVELLQQIAAARSALDQVALQIMRGHIRSCVSEAIRNEDGGEKVGEVSAPKWDVSALMDPLERSIR